MMNHDHNQMFPKVIVFLLKMKKLLQILFANDNFSPEAMENFPPEAMEDFVQDNSLWFRVMVVKIFVKCTPEAMAKNLEMHLLFLVYASLLPVGYLWRHISAGGYAEIFLWDLHPISLLECFANVVKICVKCTPEAMTKNLKMYLLFLVICFVVSCWMSMMAYFRRRLWRNFSVRSASYLATWMFCNRRDDFCQVYAGGYGQKFGDASCVPNYALLLPLGCLWRCFLAREFSFFSYYLAAASLLLDLYLKTACNQSLNSL